MRKTILKIAILMLSLLAVSATAFAQGIEIRGKVSDENGEPVAGVSIYVPVAKGTPTKATMSDGTGYYSIKLTADEKELSFECLGFASQTITVGRQRVINVVMKEERSQLDAVVVTGIFTRKAESFTGAVQTMSSSELAKVSNQNAFQALKNLDPSLVVLENLEAGSNPNAQTSLQLRGASSFNTGETGNLKSNFVDDPNMPLFILDGFETTAEKIMDMDMNRIESMTILKDASAKAIYGSKAGNGVIVIETKQLKTNETLVSYSGNVSLEMPDLTSYNLCNAIEKLEIERREGYYESISITSSDLIKNLELYNSRLKRALEGESTYWLSKPVRMSVSNQHSLTVEMGTQALKATAAFAYNDSQGVMKGSKRSTISGDVNISYRHKKWQFRNIMSVTSMNGSDSPYGTFDAYAKLNPYDNPYTDDGQLKRYLSVINNEYVGNPMYDATLNVIDTEKYLDFTDNFYAEFQMFDFLKLVARVGISTKYTSMDEFYPADHSKYLLITTAGTDDLKLQAGSYDATNGRSSTFSGDFSAQMSKNFNDAHDVFATFQYSISQNQYEEVTHYATGFPNSRMTDITFARQYAMDATPTGSSSINRNIGVLGTVGYTYKDRYMADATIRTNASSAFGTNNKWATFWSFGAGWNIHKEQWMNVSWLEQFKIRGSLGSSGNQNYASNNSIAVYKYFDNNFFNGFTGVQLANMGNKNLGWEQKMDYNVGIDLRTKHLSITADAYISDTENLVFNRSILPSTGFSSFSDNLGKVRNKGIELSVSYRVFSNSNGFLNLNAKIARNDNRILEISDALRNYNEEQQELAEEAGRTTPVIQYYDGCPVNAIWAVESLGIDPASGKEIFLDRNGNMTNTWSATDLKYCGSSDPLYNGNFGFNAELYNVGLNAVCTFYGGGYMYNTTLVDKVENVYVGYNVDKRIYSDRWYYDGQVAQYRNGYTSPTKATTRFVQKNNVLSISSISLYYNFPYKLVQKIRMERLKLALYLNDLYTFSSIQIERGTSYPYARTISLSLLATF